LTKWRATKVDDNIIQQVSTSQIKMHKLKIFSIDLLREENNYIILLVDKQKKQLLFEYFQK
jgi:hypothetical protein